MENAKEKKAAFFDFIYPRVEKANLKILDDRNLPTFKKNAKARAAEFDIHKILPLYEEAYAEVIKNYP